MLRERIYYLIKPYVPWRVRMALRRITARRKRETCRATWPISETASRKPDGWPGWPDGKQFAFVLSHDVEGPFGLEKCRPLAELEMELGFRSSFNFIPEGDYTVPPDLRRWLTERGFEVGIHDLHHDGRLYASRRGFKQNALQINRYVREWGAAGFRSGFMLRNLGWLHRLDIQYDSSTFDTDPFELQSNGVDTIFPFWVDPLPAYQYSQSPFSGTENLATARARGGYVELPYTMPQDSTLFLVLRETSPRIWLQKLDWIVSHGGMAFVDVHPDYLNIGGSRRTRREYPVERYVELLRYLGRTHAGQFWNPTPRNLAAWFKGTRNAADSHLATQATVDLGPMRAPDRTSGLAGKRAAVLLFSEYPADPRPRRAAEAMAASGMEVELLCLAGAASDLTQELVRGVRVFRVPMARRRGAKTTYLWQYGRFILSSFWFLARRSLRRKYDIVHVHNMPDVLVFSTLVPKLMGAKVILDLHDPMPELMMTIYGIHKGSTGVKLLQRLERWSIWFADTVITVNEACKKLFAARSCPLEKVRVVMNSPDESIFQHREPNELVPGGRAKGTRFSIMYHGSLVERHGLDVAVAALGKIKTSVPGAELWVYGQETPYLRQVMNSVEHSPLCESVHYFGPKNLEQIVEAINACDVGVIPNRRSIFTEINTPTRIFEYLSQGKPVIAPRAGGILDYFGPQDLVYFELGDADDLAEKLEYVFRQPAAIDETVRRGQSVYRQHCWSSERLRFLDSVADTLGVAPHVTR